jgi:hypothetical protein
MRNESCVTKTTLTGSQINLLQIKMDRLDLVQDDLDNYEKQYNEIKSLNIGFLFQNMVSLNNSIRNG